MHIYKYNQPIIIYLYGHMRNSWGEILNTIFRHLLEAYGSKNKVGDSYSEDMLNNISLLQV